MQTIVKVVERLDMSAEEAVERLRYLEFDVSGVEATITDEQFDILVDIDDDPSVVEKYREEIQAEAEKKKAKAKKKKAAAKKKKPAAKKKKAAAKKKKPAAKKKKAAAKKKKTTAKKTTAKKKTKADETKAEAETLEPVEPEIVAEILPDESEEAKPKKKAEILPEESEKKEPEITVGTAIEHEEHAAEIVRADGTHQDVSEVEVDEPPAETEGGLLAQAERAEKARQKQKSQESEGEAGEDKPLPTPDPDVVAKVIRKAEEDQQDRGRKRQPGKSRTKSREEQQDWQEEVKTTTRFAGAVQVPTHRPNQSNRRTGKTARKRMQRAERQRREEELRRQAAANVKEFQAGGREGGKKKRKKQSREEVVATPGRKVVQVEDTLTVEQLAEAMDIDTNELILELMDHNVMATKNQALGMDLIRAMAGSRGFEVEAVIPEEEDIMAEEPDNPEDLEPRAPVVTVMGHVDHGKTSLLDQVRRASVASGEAGGITQHIAAYEVELPQGRVVFLDTPGHEAFTALRARGAQITDVVVLVVAADDGIMPQTKEAIDHARAADVPIVVAVNKCDKPDAQPDRIRQELVQFDLVDEQWGGKTIIKDISAMTGEGIEELMELLVLETELLELRGNPNKRVRGAIIESEIARGLGPVAWVLVQSGTLSVGDAFLAGETYGRVRSMQNSIGESIENAGPATPVVVTGFHNPPSAGDIFVRVDEERIARSVAEQRTHRSKLKEGGGARHVTLEDFHARLLAGEKAELNVIVKADVQGSVDVLESSLPKVGNEEAQAKIIHSGVGQINESDILLASVSDAVILGFHVGASTKAEKMAQSDGVDIRSYEVIYELLEDVRKALEGMLTPDLEEVVTGHAEIRAVFKSSAIGRIAGCMITDGEIRRDSKVRVLRNDDVVFEGKLDSVKREKDDVQSVQQGFECGIKIANFDGIEEGDIIEAYKVEEVAKTLA